MEDPKLNITKRCCRTTFPLRSKFAVERGVIAKESYELLIIIQDANPDENHGKIVKHHELIYKLNYSDNCSNK